MSRRTSAVILLAIFSVVLFPLSAWSQSLTHAWSQRFGDASNQLSYAIAVDDAGNILVSGYFAGTVDFGGGPLTSAGLNDVFLAKFDASGSHLWSQRFGDVDNQYGTSVAVDAAGDILLSGYFYSTVNFGGGVLTSAAAADIFVAKFDTWGSHLWSQRFGGLGNQAGRSVAVDDAGNVLLAGYFSDTVDFGGGVLTSAGNNDIFVAKFDASGSHLWSQRFGDGFTEIASDVAVDGTGNTLVAGYFQGTVNFGGGVLTSAGNNDIFVAKFDPSGSHLWSRRFGDANSQVVESVVVDGLGNALMTGYFYSTVNFGGGVLTSAGGGDIFVAKFDPSGNHLWSAGFGDADTQYGEGVVTDAADNVVVTGYFAGTVDFGGSALTSAGSNDIFIAEFDPSGSHRRSQRFGGNSDDRAYDVAVDVANNVLATGHFYAANFGGGLLTSAGLYDIFLAKFWQAAPAIRNVRDVPGDQGGLVNVAWDGSGADTPVEHAITRYTVWRAISPAQAAAMVAAGATLGTKPPADWLAAASKPFIRSEQVNSGTYYWTLITSLDAYYLSGYAAQAPTLFDSTGVSSEYHYFQVIAHTANPYVFYTSAPDSGYSVDNLAPAVPQGLMGTQVASPAGLELEWRQNTEADLSHYAIYRGTAPDFVPGSGNLVATSADTMLTDGGWDWSAGYYYKVAALDIHDNESGHAVLAPENVTGTGNGPLPLRTYLAQNHPNPFNPTTRIVFGMKEAGDVSLRVYDASGRLVRVLAQGRHEAKRHEVQWNGRDDSGRAVASGVYFYRLVAGGETLTRKAVLLK